MQIVNIIAGHLRARGKSKNTRLSECCTSFDDVNGIRIHGYDESGRRYVIKLDLDTCRQVADLFERHFR